MRTVTLDAEVDPPATWLAQPMGLHTGLDPGQASQLAGALQSEAFAAASRGRARGYPQAQPPVTS